MPQGDLELLTSVIVLARGWEPSKEAQPMLSVESRMTVLALGSLAMQADIKFVVFSGGLIAKNGLSEAEAMKKEFIQKFPEISGNIRLEIDSDCYDTVTSAKSTQRQLSDKHLPGPYALLGTHAHIKRAQNIFRNTGMETYPIQAEDLLPHLSDHYGHFVARYKHAPRNIRYLISEQALRMLMWVDRDGSFPQKLAGKLRSKQSYSDKRYLP